MTGTATYTPDAPTEAPDRPEHPWALAAGEVLRAYGVERSEGLDGPEADRRRRVWGPNVLREHERRGAWQILVAQFRSVIVLLLAVAALLAFVFGSPVEGGAIVAVLVLNAAIGFATELRAVSSMEALRELGGVSARVLRAGEHRELPAEELVPGDLVVLEGGDVITADLRLIEASRLQVNEAPLTGESMPVEKDTEPAPRDTPLAERTNMVHKGTAVTRGSGLAVTVATGMSTELGHISSLLEGAEDEATPLEERLDALGRRLVWVTLALAGLIVVSGVSVGRELFPMVEISIALAVAAIPEGLPIVATLALARGMWRMSRRNALVERLSAVETLGSTNVILTDKTGTLTENLMSVEHLVLSKASTELDRSEPRAPAAEPESLLERVLDDEISNEQWSRALLLTAVLCNNASLEPPENDPSDATGDPMEIGLLRAGREAGLERGSLVEALPELREEAFDPETRMMATFHGQEETPWVAVKGAPESVLAVSETVREPNGIVPLDAERTEFWGQQNERLAADGYRVLGVAIRRADGGEEEPYQDLVFLGLVALRDPPRRDVAAAVEACHTAGIRVVMVTGDQAATARNVAIAVGLAEDDVEVAVGGELSVGPDGRLKDGDRLRKISVFARISPEQKLDLIALHQEGGDVVAMIGDGVNDAPALEKADIGVAMGRRGTQVAREAADIILQDDRFGTIVSAVDQGRAIFQNIRKFVTYLLSCNVSEILVVSVATLVGAPLPILPLQILFLNLVTDVFPALALGVGEGDPRSMKRPPRSPSEPFMTQRHWTYVGGYGLLLTGSVLTGLYLGLGRLELPVRAAVTMSFLVLAFGQLWHVFSMTEPESGLFRNEVTRNPWVWGAVGLCIVLLLTAVYVDPIAGVLQVAPPDARMWTTILPLSLVPLVLGRIIRSSAGLLLRSNRA